MDFEHIITAIVGFFLLLFFGRDSYKTPLDTTPKPPSILTYDDIIEHFKARDRLDTESDIHFTREPINLYNDTELTIKQLAMYRPYDNGNMFISAKEKAVHMSTPYWKALKQQRLIVSDNMCEHCSSSNSLNLHHVHYSNLTEEYIDDVIILCSHCHNRLHKIADEFTGDGYGRTGYYPIELLG